MELSCTTAAAPPLPVAIGTVYGALLNEQAALDALGDAVNAPPYGRPPQAPILYIKPANTHASDGAAVVVPAGVDALEIGASVAVVFARRATRVPAERALDYVHGFTLASDVSVPHPDYYRPAVRFKCRDGFCPLGGHRAGVCAGRCRRDRPDRADRWRGGRVCLDGHADSARARADRRRDGLHVLRRGRCPAARRCRRRSARRAGSTIEISAAGFGTLRHTLIAEEAR